MHHRRLPPVRRSGYTGRMDVIDALARRSSVRAFAPRPVDAGLLRRLVAEALEAPSWANTQPFQLAVAAGARCEALRRDMLAAADGTPPAGDHPLLFEYPPDLAARRRAAGLGLYGVLGIGRDDRERRGREYRRNFAFFDAPAVAFLFAHEGPGVYAVLDAGIFLQAFLLAATAAGLGTCAQASLASYPQVVRRHFAVPNGYRLLCGVAIGHPLEAAVNRFRPARVDPDAVMPPLV